MDIELFEILEEHMIDLHDKIDRLDGRLAGFEDFLWKIQGKLKVPRLAKLLSGLENIDSNQNELFEKINDNAKRLNDMMLEFKGWISMSRAALNSTKKHSTPVEKIKMGTEIFI